MTPSIDPTAPHVALYRRWRAQTFSQIVGQEPVVETLRNAVRLGRVAHSYLFVGPRGTGKTSMARIVAKAVNCTNLQDGDPCDTCPSCVAIREGAALDVSEFDAASSNTVGDMRDLLPRVYTAPADLRRKVFIVDEVQRITQGWDVLLKTLEEPPDHVLFVFCTTDPSQIRPAVLSRVQRFTFRPLTVPQIVGKLERILAELGRAAEPEAIDLVARLAAGGMRDAESMLDQLLSAGGEPLTAADVRDRLGMADAAAVDAFVAALVDGEALAGIRVLDRVEADGRDLRVLVDQAVERLREALVARLAGDRPGDPIAAADLDRLAGAARRLATIDAARAIGGYRLQLELALLERARVGQSASSADRAEARTASSPLERGEARSAATAASGIPTPGSGPPTPKPVRAARAPAPAGALGTPASTGPSVASPGPAVAPPSSAVASPDPAAAPPGSVAMAAPTPVPIAVEPRAEEGEDDPLGRLRAAWASVVAHVSRNPANRPLIAACRPVRIDGRVVVLGFPEDQAFLRDIAERKKASLEEGVAAVLGGAYSVRCVSTNLEALPPLPEDAAAREVLEQARRVFAGDLVDAAEIE